MAAAPAALSLDQMVALYRQARNGVREAEVELEGAERLGVPPKVHGEELARLKAALERQQRTLVRALNDRLRTTGIGGRMLMTQGVVTMGEEFVAAAGKGVRSFTAFTPDNDPHGEHDFGALEVAGVRLFFKIDCYDLAERHGSSDPADPDMTCRVLTILLPEEY